MITNLLGEMKILVYKRYIAVAKPLKLRAFYRIANRPSSIVVDCATQKNVLFCKITVCKVKEYTTVGNAVYGCCKWAFSSCQEEQ